MVQVYVSQLRKALATVDDGAEIVTRGRGYQLRLGTGDVDARSFKRLVAAWLSRRLRSLPACVRRPVGLIHACAPDRIGDKQSRRPDGRPYRVSRRGESHPPALSEPDVNLSIHPAPIVQPSGRAPNRQWANRPGSRR